MLIIEYAIAPARNKKSGKKSHEKKHCIVYNSDNIDVCHYLRGGMRLDEQAYRYTLLDRHRADRNAGTLLNRRRYVEFAL